MLGGGGGLSEQLAQAATSDTQTPSPDQQNAPDTTSNSVIAGIDPESTELSPLDIAPMASVATLDLANTSTLTNTALGFSYSGTTVTFSSVSAGQEYTITGTGAPKSIVFQSGANALIYLDGASITGGNPAISIASGASVTINLVDGTTNSFASASGTYAGIRVPANASLTIEGDTGILNATATGYGAGIGGDGRSSGSAEAGGTIAINGGTVTAMTSAENYGAAGIGGGGSGSYGIGGTGGTITITGGTVTARATSASGTPGAGIGGGVGGTYSGLGGAGGTITITGGTVTASSSSSGNYSGAGIGGGNRGDGGAINISGYAVVNATSTGTGAGIGSGGTSTVGGSISIGGDAKVTARNTSTFGMSGAAIGSASGSSAGGTINILDNAEVEAFKAGLGTAAIGRGNSAEAISLNLAATATVKAYSGGSMPAIDVANTGTGYYVNATLDTTVSVAVANDLTVLKSSDESSVASLSVPANYRNFAVSTGATTTDNYTIYKMSGSSRVAIAKDKNTTYTQIPSQKGATATVLVFVDVPPKGTIDYLNEKIDNLDTTASPTAAKWFYRTATSGAGSTWTAFTPTSGSATLASLGNSGPNNFGGAAKTLYLAYSTSASASTPSTDAQTLTIKARPQTPTVAAGVDEITGVVDDGTQEYRHSGDSSWTTVSDSPQGVTTTGNFEVRVKAVANTAVAPAVDNGSFASLAATVTVLSSATLAINGGADMSFTYPSNLETEVKAATVTSSSGTLSWYYTTTAGAPLNSYTSGLPDKPGIYYIYAKCAATSIYAEAASAPIMVTWNKKVLDVSANATFTKVYDQTTAVSALPGSFPALTQGTAAGQSGAVEPTDSVSITGPAVTAYSFDYSTVAAASAVTTPASGFTLSGTTATGTHVPGDYYTLGSGNLSWTASITPAPLTVDFSGLIFTKTYDATSVATNSGSAPALSGILSSDSVSLDYSQAEYAYGVNASTPSPDAGTGLSVYLTLATWDSFSLSGTAAGNYSLTEPVQTTAVSNTGTITPLEIDANPANYDSTYGIDWYFDAAGSPVTLSALNPTPSVLFTGSAHSISARVKSSVLASATDDVIINLVATGASGTAPGTYTATTVDTGTYALSGPQAQNYVLSQVLSQPWEIVGTVPSAPYDLHADSSTMSAIVFDWAEPTFDGGSAVTFYEVQYMPVADVSVIASLTEANWTGAVTTPLVTALPSSTQTTTVSLTVAGTYAWRVRAANTASTPSADDWSHWSVAASANPDTLAPTLAITTTTLSCNYGESLKDILDSVTAGQLSATGSVSVGSYTAGTQMPGTWSWRDVSDTTIPTNNLPGTTDAFTLVFTPESALAATYGANTIDVNILITPKELTIDYTDMDFEKPYDGLNAAANLGSDPIVDATAIIGTDDVHLDITGVHYVFDDANAGTGKSVYIDGTGAMYALAGTDAANYSFATPLVSGTSGTVISSAGLITPRPLSFTWTLDATTITNPAVGTDSVVFDNVSHTVSASALGMVTGESVTVSGYGSSSVSATFAGDYQAEVNTISVSNAGGPNASTVAANYDINVASATQDWQISKYPVAVSWADTSFAYDTAAHRPTATYTPIATDSTAPTLTVTVSTGPVNSSGLATDAGSYTALASLPQDANYALTGTISQDFTITQKLLHLDFSALAPKLATLPYSGDVTFDIAPDAMPTFTSGEVYASDNPGVDVLLTAGNAKWHLSSSSVGGPYNLNIDGDFGLTGSRASNYALVPGQSWTMMPDAASIAPRPLDFAWTVDGLPIAGSSYNIPYDGASHTVSATVTNAVTGQALTVASYTTASTLNATEGGSYTATVATVAAANSSTDADNYTMTGATNATLAWNIVKSAPSTDKTALTDYTNKVLAEDLHEENFTASAWSALQSALTSANAVLADVSATQAQVDQALADLQTAYGALKHDHPIIKHSHDTLYGGVYHLTHFGETVTIEFKGDIRDVSGFKLNGTDYPLTSGGVDIYNITESGTVIGTITKGSALITLPSAFSDRFTNGTHKLELLFTDAVGTGSGIADLVVNRTGGGGDNGGNGGNGNDDGSALPQTTDGTSPLTLALTALLAAAGLTSMALRPRKVFGQHLR